MSGWEQVQAMLRSRKFWAMVTAIVAAAAALATNQIDTWQFITAVVIAMGAYSTGVAIEDAGQKMGQGMASSSPSDPGRARFASSVSTPLSEVVTAARANQGFVRQRPNKDFPSSEHG